MADMKRDETKPRDTEKKTGLTEKQFIEYLEERFRKLKQDEQRFRNEVLARNTYPVENSGFTNTR